jgi:hypothetical protein
MGCYTSPAGKTASLSNQRTVLTKRRRHGNFDARNLSVNLGLKKMCLVFDIMEFSSNMLVFVAENSRIYSLHSKLHNLSVKLM